MRGMDKKREGWWLFHCIDFLQEQWLLILGPLIYLVCFWNAWAPKLAQVTGALHSSMDEPQAWPTASSLERSCSPAYVPADRVTMHHLVTHFPPTLGSHWTPEISRLLPWGWEFDTKGPFALKVIRFSPSFFPLKFLRCYFRVPLGWCWSRGRPEDPGSAWIPAWWLSIPVNGGVGVSGVVSLPGTDGLLKPWVLSSSPLVSAPSS